MRMLLFILMQHIQLRKKQPTNQQKKNNTLYPVEGHVAMLTRKGFCLEPD